MIDTIVSQFLQSGAGTEVLSQLKTHGLDAAKASSAVTATAEGAMQQLSGGAGGLGALAAGMLGGASAGSSLSALTAPVAQFVAQKTGLSPEIAQTVVGVALPKLMALLQSNTPAAAATGGLGAALGGLFK